MKALKYELIFATNESIAYDETRTARYVAEGETMNIRLAIDREQVADFCRRWKIMELALFGSVLRDDFRPESDVDVLVSFAPDAPWSLWDHVDMEEELSNLLGRKVDLVSRRAVEQSRNWIRRQAILNTAESYYVAR